jgi:hypothetical protein
MRLFYYMRLIYHISFFMSRKIFFVPGGGAYSELAMGHRGGKSEMRKKEIGGKRT